MQKISFFLLLISLSTCFAQHWSYGFQPGGKRNVENLRDSFQEIDNEMDKAGELQPFECSVPRQHFTLRGLKGVLTGEPPFKCYFQLCSIFCSVI
uniref:Progonadoliberin-1 n=1 Tax=Naja naja TaxID=35670 RepID=A0A8C6XPG9_NAJNA